MYVFLFSTLHITGYNQTLRYVNGLPCSLGSRNQWSTAASRAFLSPSPPPLSHLQSDQALHRPPHRHPPVVSAKTEGSRGGGVGGRGTSERAVLAALLNTKPKPSAWVSHSTYLPLTRLTSSAVTSAFCSSMATVAT